MSASLDIVWTRSLLSADRDDYDRFVAEAASGHYAQSRAWEAVARAARSSFVYYFLARERGRVVGTALVTRAAWGPVGLPWAWAFRGPVSRDPGELSRVASALAETTRTHGIARLSVTPYWAGEDADAASRALRTARFLDVQRPDGAHAWTARIDLARISDEELLSSPGQAYLRRRWTQANRAGAVAHRGTKRDLETHAKLTDVTLRAQGKSRPRTSYYDALWTHMLADGRRGALFVCEDGGQTVATVVVLRHGGVAVYAQGATGAGARPSRFSKSVPPLMAAVRWAREQGCHTFDLGGIPGPEDLEPKRRRIAHLKLDFARTPVRLVPEHARFL